MRSRRVSRTLGTVAAASAMLAIPMVSAQAYNPTGGTLYQLGNEPCLKGRGNCAVYPKSAQLPGGRLVASFEKSTVVSATGSADGQTLPVYKSDDDGTSWQPLSEVKAPAYLSGDPRYAKYTSNWTNPYLYVLPEKVGDLAKGTLLLASVVSGDDYYYKEHKAADPAWTPNNDGDRKDLAIALYSSADEEDLAGRQRHRHRRLAGRQRGRGRSEHRRGQHRQAGRSPLGAVPDGLQEQARRLLLRRERLHGLRSGHRCPDARPRQRHGHGLARSDPRAQDLEREEQELERSRRRRRGSDQDMGGGKKEIGGGRPGMTNVVRTADGRWLLTFEYWGGAPPPGTCSRTTR